MTLRELLYIKTIADERSITKAAQKLYLTQPSLSHCVITIENQLGAKLFQRTSSGLNLTYVGERYYHTACEIMRIYEDFENEVRDASQLTRGRITFGITNYLATEILPGMLIDFHSRYPGIELNMREDTSSRMEQSLLSGELDFVIMHDGPEHDIALNPGIRCESLGRDPFVLVAPPDTPFRAQAQERGEKQLPVLDPALLRDVPFLMITRGQRIRQIADRILDRAGFEPKILLTSKNFETLRRLAASGLGYTLLPWQYMHIFGGGEYKPMYFALPEKYNAYWDLVIATGQNDYLSSASEKFLEFFREKAKKSI